MPLKITLIEGEWPNRWVKNEKLVKTYGGNIMYLFDGRVSLGGRRIGARRNVDGGSVEGYGAIPLLDQGLGMVHMRTTRTVINIEPFRVKL